MPTPPRTLTHDGITLTLKEWSKKTGIPVETIRSRVDHQRWSVADALTTPTGVKYRPKRKPPAAPRPCPKLQVHSKGLACVRWWDHGKEHIRYFGPAGSEEAAQAYKRFAIEWATGLDSGSTPPAHLRVHQLSRRYLDHVERYYVKDGRQTSEVHGQKAALKFLNQLYADELVTDIKGRHLKACQQAMKVHGLVRASINQHTWRITRCFRWGVGEDLVPPAVADVLESVPNLQVGRTDAAETEPVMSVPIGDVEKTIPHLDKAPGRRAVLEAMIRFSLAAGTRPGELCAMTADQIDRADDVWCYRAPNKNQHRQTKRKPRMVWLGPRAQAVLAPHLDNPGPGGRVWCFPPRGKSATRRTPVSRGAFAEAVRLACRAAKVEPWHPHQLRHNRATEVQRLYEDDAAAAAVIGDTPQVARLVYVDPNEAVARRIAKATG